MIFDNQTQAFLEKLVAKISSSVSSISHGHKLDLRYEDLGDTVRMHFICDCGKRTYVDACWEYAIEEWDGPGILSDAICCKCSMMEFYGEEDEI